MRVGMSAYRFDRQGGIERASYELARSLADQGTAVTLIATGVDPPASPPLRTLPVPMPRIPGFLVPGVYPRRASRAVRAERFDVLHDQGACALVEHDVVTAHSCHRAWWEMKLSQGERARALLNPLHRVVLATEQRSYRPGRYSRVIAVSAGVGRELTRFYDVPPERIRVIPNAVDAGAFDPPDRDAVRARVRTQHGLRDDEFVLLFVGKEFRRKGLGAAIDALPLLPENVRLLVVGGDDQKPFRARAAGAGVGHRVVYAGHSPRVQDYFAAGDAFVFPTLYEAFALVSLEAAAAGLPLVTTRVNGTEDFVQEGGNGFLVERDGRSIAAAVGRLVADPDLTARLGAAARRGVGEYTWENAARRTREVYDEVIEERSARR